MTTKAPEVVYVRDMVTRRIHRRVKNEGVRGLYTNEHEGPDTSGVYQVMTAAQMEGAEPYDLCTRCFEYANSTYGVLRT